MAEYQQLCEGIETLDDLKYEPRHVTEARRDATLEAIRALQAVEQFARAHAANPDRPFPTPYSPECVEEEFCELRLYGVL
jgi:ribosomal protein L34E